MNTTSTAKANTVLSVDPSGGATVALDTPITITYAPGTGTVPNFFGLDKAAAQAQADRMGFSVTFSEEESSAQPEGFVFSQDPAVGTEIKRSQKIQLVLAKEPPTPPTSPTPSPSPTPTPTKSGD